MQEQILEFFIIAGLKDSETGELSPEAAEYDIETIDDWYDRMDELVAWAMENGDMIRLNLGPFRAEWGESCDALEELLDS